MHAHSPVSFSKWGRPVHRWSSPEDFLTMPHHASDLHSIALPGGVVDLGFNGEPLGPSRPKRIPVFFLGLTKDRNGALGPYFSGLNISAEIGTPSIMVADPTISDHGDLTLAWYAGCSEFNATQALHMLLKGIADRYDVELLLIGGSGGGFAALSAAQAIGPSAQVFCWNPQTDILRYVPQTISDYLRSAHPESLIKDLDPADAQEREQIRGYFEERAIQTTVGSAQDDSKVLLLQNGSDWHVTAHCLPYVVRRGLEPMPGLPAFGSGLRTVAVGSWGKGHISPPRDLTVLTARVMLGGAGPEETLRTLVETLGSYFPQRPEISALYPSVVDP